MDVRQRSCMIDTSILPPRTIFPFDFLRLARLSKHYPRPSLGFRRCGWYLTLLCCFFSLSPSVHSPLDPLPIPTPTHPFPPPLFFLFFCSANFLSLFLSFLLSVFLCIFFIILFSCKGGGGCFDFVSFWGGGWFGAGGGCGRGGGGGRW